MTQEVIISENYTRVDRFIKKNIFLSITQSLLERYLRKGLVTLEGKRIKSNTKVEKGQKLFIDENIFFTSMHDHLKKTVKNHVINHEILYQDEYVIVLNKPSGLAVQGGNKVVMSINDSLQYFERVNNEIPRIVHRIDKDTSGVLLLARTLQSARFLAESFANNKIKKNYKAIVSGQLFKKNGMIDIPLAKKVVQGQEIISPDHECGKKSLTYFERLRIIPKHNITYLKLQPITGRKHQLRAHMKYLGHPIYGDKKYGSNHNYKLSLHAHSINVILPNNKNISVTAPLPQHILEML